MRWLIGVLISVLVLGGIAGAAQVYDPLNVVYKRLKADDRYQYEEVDPVLLEAGNPEELLSFKSAGDVLDRRQTLTQLVYGASIRNPVQAYRSGGDSKVRFDLQDLDGVDSVYRFYLTPRKGVLSFFYLMLPDAPKEGRAAIYHNGFSGTSIQSAELLEGLMAEGVTVIAIDQLGYGENARDAHCETPTYPATCVGSLQFQMDKLDLPLRDHVEPVRAALDLLTDLGFEEVDAIGFSAGAATVTFVASLDDRIKKTAAVAGVLPYYLREGQDAAAGLAAYGPLKEVTNMMDLFLMASAGDGRAHLHLFNRFDRCCYRNVKGFVYEPALQDRLEDLGLGGRFEVQLDESHARHAISSEGTEMILRFFGY